MSSPLNQGKPSSGDDPASNAQQQPDGGGKAQPWRQFRGMPAAGADEDYEKGKKGVPCTEGSVRLDNLQEVGTQLGG